MSEESGNYAPIPVSGYRHQNQETIDDANHTKAMEERVLRWLDRLADDGGIDKRWLAIGRTHIEQGFMAVCRSIFQPDRANLPEDRASGEGKDEG